MLVALALAATLVGPYPLTPTEIAAAVMAVLAFPLIGFVLLDVSGGVTLGTRFGAVAVAIWLRSIAAAL